MENVPGLLIDDFLHGNTILPQPTSHEPWRTRRGNSNLDYALEATGTGATAHFIPNGCGFSRKLKKALVHLQKEADLDMLEGMLKASGWRIQQ